MRVCIIGAGAIGGLLAARLAQTGNEVCVVARGAHLAAIREKGLTLIGEDGRATTQPVPAASEIGECGPQDCVILSVKAHQVAAVAGDLKRLFEADTMVMTAQNGIPWWYFMGQDGPFAGRRLESVDPGGTITAHLPADRLVGSVVYPAAEIVEPGVIRHVEGLRFSIAEITGVKTARVAALARALAEAGFKAPISSDLRGEIWTKLLGNMSMNPISALTHANLDEICAYPPTRDVAVSMMREAQAVGERLGVRFRISIEKRIAGAAAVGAHKTSMLQDVEAGRFLEADALIGSIVELGAMVGEPTPITAAVYACVKLLAQTLATRRGRLRVEPA